MQYVRPLLALLAILCAWPAAAGAAVRIVSAVPAGPVVEGQVVDIVVETAAPADAARLTFPDLHGAFGSVSCALGRGPGARRFVLPYRPAWPGLHSLQLTVTAGACGMRPSTDGRVISLEAQPAAAPAPAVASGCAGADSAPVPRTTRATRLAVVCLLNAARAARGLPALAPNRRLRRIASRSAHRPGGRVRPGEQRTVTPGTSASNVVAAWLANEGHARDLLDPAVRRVGVAVVARFPEPLRRPETTYVVKLR